MGNHMKARALRVRTVGADVAGGRGGGGGRRGVEEHVDACIGSSCQGCVSPAKSDATSSCGCKGVFTIFWRDERSAGEPSVRIHAARVRDGVTAPATINRPSRHSTGTHIRL
jgi:hypothetical protein